MDTAQVAKQLVDLCRIGEFEKAVDDLYSKDIVSVEPMAMGSMPAEARGIEAIRGKGKWWSDNHTVHSCKVAGPFVARNQFVVEFTLDVTDKPTSKRSTMTEAGVYTVQNGKIVREEFFYSA